MLAKEQDEAIVLAKIDRGEADRVFVVLAKNQGKINLLAKGERKILSKLRQAIDVFYLTKITFIESPRRLTLTDVDLINDFPKIRANWRKFEVAMRISDLLQDVLPIRGKDKEIFSLTIEILKDLSRATQYFQRYYYYFLWRLLDLSGYIPQSFFNSRSGRKTFVSRTEGVMAKKPKTDFVLCRSETKEVLQNILLRQKKIFYRQSIPLAVQKNLATISKVYLEFLDLGKDGYSLGFRL